MKLHYAETINARKACVTAKHLNIPVDFVRLDFRKGDQNSPSFRALNPNGKVPVLELDDGTTLWESNAIVCHLAREAGSELYPADDARQIEMIRWFGWSSEHFNRYTFRIYFENLVKPMLGLGAPNVAGIEEAHGFIRRYGAVLNDHLESRHYMLGDRLTVVDFIVGISLPYAQAAKIPLDGFSAIARWGDRLNALPAWSDPFPATKVAA
jgi:glutathione S-transferase